MTPPTGRLPTAWWRATALALIAAAAVVTTWVGAAVPAQAAQTCDGVWVVVDASEVGGELSVRCAEGDPESGLAALSAAGHDYSFVPRIPGMVCTIDGRPDPCNGAPEDAYWSYWRAQEGGSWSYASRGAGEQDPKPGDVEGWAFGAGDPPGTAPPAPGPDDDEAETDTGQGDGDDGSETSGDGDAGADDGSGSDDQGQDAGSSDGGSGGGSEQAQAEAGDGDDPSDERGDEQGDEQGDTDADGAASSSDDGELDRDGPQVPRPAADDGTGDDAAGDDRSREDEDDPGDEDAPSRVDDRSDEVEDADAVAIGGRSGGADWAGVAVGATLVVALAGGAVLQGRRRRLGPGP